MRDIGWGCPAVKTSKPSFREANSKYPLTYTNVKGKLWVEKGKQLYLEKKQQQWRTGIKLKSKKSNLKSTCI